MASPTEITVPQLSRLIGAAHAPVLINMHTAMSLYYAFYRWTRDAIDETHEIEP